MKIVQIIISVFLLVSVSCSSQTKPEKVLFGSDVFVSENIEQLRNKKVALVANQASVLSNGTNLLDTLKSLGINISVVFTPEHGFSGKFAAGEFVEKENIDHGFKSYSLYGKTKTPTPEMLKNTDIIIFDLQDVGVRFYTYISTMFYVLQSAAENNKKVIILDRPNPLSGNKLSGSVLQEDLKSFIGIAPISLIHGMTIGELANLFVTENYIQTSVKPDLEIIRMKNWKREFYWDDINANWIPTSPNIPDFETVLIYPAACLLEGTDVSEGRGTEHPFKLIGAPFIDPGNLIDELDQSGIGGCELTPGEFMPISIPGKSVNPKFENKLCKGINIKITDKKKFDQLDFGTKLLITLHKLYPEDFEFIPAHFDHLTGDKKIREMIEGNQDVNSVIDYINRQSESFKSTREKYLLY